MNLQAFIEDFVAQTQPNPFNERERCWQWRTAIWIERMRTQPAIALKGIRTLGDLRKGNGSAGLAWLCQLADKHEVTLYGVVSPFGTRKYKLNKYELITWYRRHGFIVDRIHMYRHPQLYNTGDNNACRYTAATV